MASLWLRSTQLYVNVRVTSQAFELTNTQPLVSYTARIAKTTDGVGCSCAVRLELPHNRVLAKDAKKLMQYSITSHRVPMIALAPVVYVRLHVFSR